MDKPKPKNQRETVEEFLKRGGKIRKIESVKCDGGYRPLLIRGTAVLDSGCYWVMPAKGCS